MYKPLFITLFSLITLSQSVFAANVDVITDPNARDVAYSRVFIEVIDRGTELVAGRVYIYHDPLAFIPGQPGRFDQIFINQLNGTQFCRTLGHAARNTEGDGGSITCGEDESAFADFNFNTQAWESRATGSANRCFPLYKTIQCQ